MRPIRLRPPTVASITRLALVLSAVAACSGAQDELRTGHVDGTSAEPVAATVPPPTGTATVRSSAAPTTQGEPTGADVALLPPAQSELAPGEPMRLSLGTHCGVRILGRTINDTVWRTREGAGTIDWIPAEWAPDESFPDGPIDIRVVLSSDGRTITGSLNGREVVYHADGTDFRPEDLCD